MVRGTVVPVLSWTLIVFPARAMRPSSFEGFDELSFIEHVSSHGREEFILVRGGVRSELGRAWTLKW
jgi:hypothetical protein